MRTCRHFTPEEDEELIRLRLIHYGHDRGLFLTRPKGRYGPVVYYGPGGVGTIAKLMGRAKSSIQMRLAFLAMKEEDDS